MRTTRGLGRAALLSSMGARAATNTTTNCNIATFQKFLDANGTVAQVVYAQHYAEGSTFVNPNATLATGVNPTDLPATCAVQVNATTEYDTHYSFGIFLPDNWNGRFL